jgi:hypothetical protein
MLPKLNSNIIEVLVANHFDYRKNIIIPNVTHFFNHEADVLIVRPKTGYCIEVEIKISKSDLKADLKKWHNHSSSRIKELWFCMPENMIELAIELLPEHIGLLAVCELEAVNNKELNYYLPATRYLSVKRQPTIINKSVPFEQKDINKLLHLGIMRIWKLKANTLPKSKKVKIEEPKLF